MRKSEAVGCVATTVAMVFVWLCCTTLQARSQGCERSQEPVDDYKYLKVDGSINIGKMEAEASVIAVNTKANVVIESHDDGGQWSHITPMRIVYGDSLLKSNEWKIGKRVIRERIETLGFRFATYREALAYLPKMEKEDWKYRLNLLIRGRSVREGNIRDNVLVVKTYRKGRRFVFGSSGNKRFDRRDVFLVVRKGEVEKKE